MRSVTQALNSVTERANMLTARGERGQAHALLTNEAEPLSTELKRLQAEVTAHQTEAAALNAELEALRAESAPMDAEAEVLRRARTNQATDGKGTQPNRDQQTPPPPPAPRSSRLTRDPHLVLGVMPGATKEEVREAYRTRAEICHPDRFVDKRPAVQAEAAEQMKELNEAYQALQSGTVRQESPRPQTTPPPSSSQTTSSPPGTVEVVCSGCAQRLRVPGEATRFKCPRCNVVWIFVQCPACKSSLRVNETFDAWSCLNCKHREASSWATTFTIACLKCKTALRVAKGVRSFKCFKCSRIYNRCACGVYSHVPALAGRRWQCPSCRRWNVR
jgi:LSD1 subclass zinc finger protein